MRKYLKKDVTIAKSHTIFQRGGRVLAKSAELIYKHFGLQAATLPFPCRRPKSRPGKGFVRPYRRSISARRFNFCRPTRVGLSLHSIPRSALHLSPRDTYRQCQIPLFSIHGDGLTPPIQNYHAVYDCCIHSRRKLRLPVVMKKNDL